MRRSIIFYSLLIGTPLVVKLFILLERAPVTTGPSEKGLTWSIVVAIADVFLATFNDRYVAMALSSLIILAAISLSCLFWFRRVRPIRREIDQAIVEIEGRRRAGVVSAQALEQVFDRFPRLRSAWKRWSQSFCTIRAPTERTVYASIAAEEAFSLTALDSSGVPFSVFRKLPDLFVGLGLIFTFCGLVAGLYFAGKGLTSADLEAAKGSLLNLLNASTFKFLTSIAGVSGSLVIAFVVQTGLEGIRRALDRLTLVLGELIPHNTIDRETAIAPLNKIANFIAPRRSP